MKRKSRKLSQETRRKISNALRNKPKTEAHREALSTSLRAYWQTIPAEENEAEE